MSEQVMTYTARGFGFNGCDHVSPDHCACATWTPQECPVCEEEIVDGQEVLHVVREVLPYLPEDDVDQDWEHTIWHAACDKGSLAAAAGDTVALLRGIGPRLRAFGRDCVHHGDMTPGARRMLDSIAALYDGVEDE